MNAQPTAVEAIAAARERTLAERSARIELVVELDWASVAQMPRKRRGGLSRPVISVAKRVFKIATRNVDLGRISAEGVADFAGRRSMLDAGSFARLHADGKEWSGRSGRPLHTLPAEAQERPTALWLVDLLAGVTGATDAGQAEVRGVSCRCLHATVDVSRASAATPGGVAVPEVPRFEDLLAFPVEVCIDDRHVRRIRVRLAKRIETLESWDFGVALDDLDWTRLPTFRSPGEAAELARARAKP